MTMEATDCPIEYSAVYRVYNFLVDDSRFINRLKVFRSVGRIDEHCDNQRVKLNIRIVQGIH